MTDLPEGYKAFPRDDGPTSKIALTIVLIFAFPVVLIFMGLVFVFLIYQGLEALGVDIFEALRGLIPANLRLVWKLLGLLYISIYLFLLVKVWSGFSFKRLRKAFYVWLIILIAGGMGIWQYNRSLYVLDDNSFWSGRFAPFLDDSLTSVLPQAPAIKIAADWPQFGTESELYPVVAAFTQATYNYEINRDGSSWKYRCPYISVEGQERSFANLLNAENDFAVMGRLANERIEQARAAGIELRVEPLGKKALVFFTHGGNKVENLTIDQIQAVFNGQITNWQQLGGKNADILAYQHDDVNFSQKWLKEIMSDTAIIKPETGVGDDWGQEYEYVVTYKNYKNAFGFSLSNYAKHMLQNKNMKLLMVNGVYPDNASIANGTYPFTQTFYVVYRADNQNPNVHKLVDWMLSPQGQYLIEASGYVPIGDSGLK